MPPQIYTFLSSLWFLPFLLPSLSSVFFLILLNYWEFLFFVFFSLPIIPFLLPSVLNTHSYYIFCRLPFFSSFLFSFSSFLPLFLTPFFPSTFWLLPLFPPALPLPYPHQITVLPPPTTHQSRSIQFPHPRAPSPTLYIQPTNHPSILSDTQAFEAHHPHSRLY